MNQPNLSSFIWSVADLLRGDYKQSDYGKVILPFTVLRRLDCVLEATKDAVLKEKEKREAAGLNPEPFLIKKSGQLFYNTSPLDMMKLMGDRRYVLENDLLEAIIGLPTDMFYNTGISTYIWIVSNRKPASRKGKVQLIDASAMWQKMRKSLGSKRKELSEDHIAEITRLFGEAKDVSIDPETGKAISRKALASGSVGTPISRIFNNTDFGYQTITVERPERDDKGKVVKETKGKRKGKPKPNTKLRDSEDVPLGEDVDEYFQREVIPHVPDAWIDHDKTKTGYEIPFNRHFHVFKPPRELDEIDAELKGVTDRIVEMIGALSQ